MNQKTGDFQQQEHPEVEWTQNDPLKTLIQLLQAEMNNQVHAMNGYQEHGKLAKTEHKVQEWKRISTSYISYLHPCAQVKGQVENGSQSSFKEESRHEYQKQSPENRLKTKLETKPKMEANELRFHKNIIKSPMLTF